MHTSEQILNIEFTKNFSRDGCVANVHTVWDCVVNVHVVQVFLRKILGTQYGPVGTRFFRFLVSDFL